MPTTLATPARREQVLFGESLPNFDLRDTRAGIGAGIDDDGRMPSAAALRATASAVMLLPNTTSCGGASSINARRPSRSWNPHFLSDS
jgi:hypothetical protein